MIKPTRTDDRQPHERTVTTSKVEGYVTVRFIPRERGPSKQETA